MAEPKTKDDQLMIRISSEEKKALKSAANIEDRTASDWVRALVRSRLRELGFLPEKKPPKRANE